MPDQRTRFGVVVGVDESKSSTAAVQWGAREAAIRNVGLTLVHAAAPPAAGSSTVVWNPNRTEALARQADNAHRMIDDAVKAAEDAAGTLQQIHTDVIYSPPVPTLVEMSEQAQMLVVGRRGRSLLTHMLLGSTSTAVLHRAHCPVAVIPDEFDAAMRVTTKPVLVGVGSPSSEPAIAIAFAEASRRGVGLVALHASCGTDPFGVHELEWADAETSAHEALVARLAGWQERYPDVTVRRIPVVDRPARHLLEQAEAAQLVVVGSQGRGRFAGALLGSVSTALVGAARSPVIVARQR